MDSGGRYLVHVNIQPACPRCGYDLQGQVATWHPQGGDAEGACCPCTGTCSECGLAVEWRLVMRPELIALQWFVETERPPRKRWSSWRTAWHALRPWSFWREVRIETAFTATRLAWWVLWLPFTVFATLLTVLLVACVLHLVLDGRWVMQSMTPIRDVLRECSAVSGKIVQTIVQSAARALSLRSGLAWWPAITCGVIVPPLMLMALPFTRAASKVRMRHVARAAIYACAPVMPIMITGIFVNTLNQILGWQWRQSLNRVDPFSSRWWWAGDQPQSLWLVVMMWFIVWWGCAFKIGFRMNDWRQALAAVMVPTVIVQSFAMSLNIDFSFMRVW